MYYKIERPGKEGTLKSLVSKFESLSSPSKNLNRREKASREPNGDGKDGKLKEKGWRTVVVLKIRMKGSHEEQSLRNSSETHSAEAKRLSPMNSGGLGPFVKNHDNIYSGCQTSPVVRGKKEGRKWQGVGLKIEGGDSQTDGNIKAGTETGLKAERCGERKESVIQMRIRLLEHSQRTQQEQKPTIPKERTIVRSVTSPKVSSEMHAPCSVTQKLETAAGAQQEPIESQAFKVPSYRFGTRNRKEASPKSLAPIIRERMKMFETRDGATVNLAASDRINDKGKAIHESGGEIFWGTKEVVGEKHVKVGWQSPTTNQLNKTMSAFSKCLAERKRSRTGCMVDGKYVSAFAFRRKAKETSSSASWATTAASRESEPASLNENSIEQTSSRPTNRANGIAFRHVLQPLSKQQSNSSRLPISSSSASESRPNTLSNWSYDSHEASPPPPTARSIPSPWAGKRTQRCAPTDTLPQARNLRASEIIAMANGREQFAASQRILQEHAGTENVGSAGVGVWVDSESSDDEDGTLIVQSVAKLREPKPLRITDVSSLAKICRLGRTRGDLG